MKKKVGKILPLVGAMCLTVFGSAFADSNYETNSFIGHSEQNSDENLPLTRSVSPVDRQNENLNVQIDNFYLTANFIYWKAVQDGIRYATNGVDQVQRVLPIEQSGIVQFVGVDWEPGFKVGFGVILDHDKWDIFAQYTWLRANDSNNIKSLLITDENNPTLQEYVFVSFLATAQTDAFLSQLVTADWNLKYNVIDAELGRKFYLTPNLAIRPFIGLKATWQDQNLTIRVHQAFVQSDPPNGTGEVYKIKLDVDTWGIGIRGGLNSSFYMTKNWSIYGNFAWTSMWVEYSSLDRNDTIFPGPTTENQTPVNRVDIINDPFYTIKYVTEMELGLSWEIWWSNEAYHFAVQAGWEHHIWCDWGQIPIFNELQADSDLTFHGLNLRFRFDF